MSARSYLSIGDVLTLLRQEFPDVTISKIRFLESQGLVNPERTPSGYRKFYEHDVERLRWVLRQQREHFLPLKVIKDRLDDDSGSSPPATVVAGRAAESVPTGNARADDATADDAPADAPADDPRQPAQADVVPGRPVLVGQHAVTEHGRGSTLPGIESALPSVGGAGPIVRGIDGPASSAAPATSAVRATARQAAVGEGDQHSPAGGTAVGAAGGTAVGSAARRSRSSGGDAEPSRRGKASAPAVAAPADDVAPAANGVTETPPSRTPSRSSASARRKPGTSLSAEELAATCGLDLAVVRELEEFGLVAPTNVAGVESFGEDALAVAQLAARFSQFGIEPRHLRLYKNAADREAGFVEQVVLPLVRQRNPDARARAREAADELALLGQQLRSCLLRTALGDLLEG